MKGKSVKNAIIAQSGGPTSVINNSIRGAIDTLISSDKINRIYGAKMGILGVLNENLLDISSQSKKQISLLSYTPSAGVLGSCRYKIRNDLDLERIIEVFKKHDIGYFFYCGGGDSMDTASKISVLAEEKGFDLIVAGIPKTIDNDVGGKLKADGTFDICDHDPGYGSVARNTAINVIESNHENMASYTSDPVLVITVMGREIGFIAASARLADPERKIPLVIISEGVNLGDLGVIKDNFGHVEYGSTATSAGQLLINYLNGLGRKDRKTRLVVRGYARCEVPGTRQRREAAYISEVDLLESYKVGEFAANIALKGENGYMATILRVPGEKYRVIYDKVPLEDVANSEREFPKEWLIKEKADVTDDFIKWAMPLTGGNFPKYSEFKEIYAGKKCPSYIPFNL